MRFFTVACVLSMAYAMRLDLDTMNILEANPEKKVEISYEIHEDEIHVTKLEEKSEDGGEAKKEMKPDEVEEVDS